MHLGRSSPTGASAPCSEMQASCKTPTKYCSHICYITPLDLCMVALSAHIV